MIGNARMVECFLDAPYTRRGAAHIADDGNADGRFGRFNRLQQRFPFAQYRLADGI